MGMMENDTKLTAFVLEHEGDDTGRLLLSAQRWPQIDMPRAVDCILSRRRMKTKVPQWYDFSSLIYPNTISAEQCSSSATAEIKASVALRALDGKAGRIADLTGGLGVDSWFFSKFFQAVLHNEMDPEISACAEYNFRELGAGNIEISNEEVTPGNIAGILEEFRPDLVYMDPARRSSGGSKVFRLEDCRPNVLELKDKILESCRFLLLKLSPMADISMVCKQLGIHCREVNVVEAGGECKELLILMDREFDGRPRVKVPGTDLNFLPEEEKAARASFVSCEEQLLAEAGSRLYEPSPAVLKAGAFNLLCERFPGLEKLGRSTQLYLDKSHTGGLPGKIFTISEIHPMNKATMKDLARRFPKSELTARNLPLSSEQLKKKMGLASGDDAHIFALRCEFSDRGSGNYLFVTKAL